jgi:hypothetical protein
MTVAMGEEGRARRAASARRGAILAMTTMILVFSCVSVWRTVDPANLRAPTPAAPGRPIAFDDHALQFYYGRLGSQFLAEGGRTHGYDPHFMAGYPKSPVYYPSSRPYELSLWLFGGADQGRVFNWTILVLLAACPFLMYAAAASLGLSDGGRLVVAALAAVPHLLVPIADFYRYMEPAGMESYIFASALSVLVAALFARFVRTGGRGTGLALWATAPLLYFTHPAAVVISVVPIAVMWVAHLRHMPVPRHLWLAVVAATVLVANWPWIEGQLLFGHYADLRDFYTPEGRAHFVPEGGWLAPIRTYVPTPKALALMPPVLGLVGLALWARERCTGLLLLVVPQVLFLFVVSFYGRYLELAALAPGRITLPLGLWLLLPAGHAAVAAVAAVARGGAVVARRPVGGPLAVALTGMVLVAAAHQAGLEKRVWRSYTFPAIEAWQGFTRHGMALVHWLGEHTDRRGRLLHEETDRGSHQYYGSHMPALIPLHTGLELAGGPAPHALLTHNVLRFEAGTLLGQPLERLAPEDVLRRFRLYNVRWVLCWTTGAKRWFDAFPGAQRVGAYDKFVLYRTSLEPSFFFEGSGTVEAVANRLALRDIVPRDGRIVLKYHWLETLRADPPREVVPLMLADDPVPFIMVPDPPRQLVIYNDYGAGLADWMRRRYAVARAGTGGRVKSPRAR